MTLNEIYNTFVPGSKGFVNAIETHCGFDISSEEIERIEAASSTSKEFQEIYENDDFWTDANNG